MTDIALWNSAIAGARLWGAGLTSSSRNPLAAPNHISAAITGWDRAHVLYGTPDAMSTTPDGVVLIQIKFDADRRGRSAQDLRAPQFAAYWAGCAGTGGSFSRAISILKACSLGSLGDRPWPATTTSEESVATPVAETVARIRSAFSLRMTELAAILRVERPTVYAWVRGDSSPLAHNYERLSEIAQIVGWWRAIGGPALGNAVRQATPGQESLVTMLSKDDFDANAVRGLLRSFARQSADIDEAALAQAKARVERRRWRAASKDDTDDQLSVETGQRLGPE